MANKLRVTKRSGTLEELDIAKIHKVLMWACRDLTGVSVSAIEIKSNLSFYDKIKTSEIHETLIQATADLISEENTNYQYVAGRLINYALRKEVYGEPEPSSFYPHVKKVVELGFYDPEILTIYTEDELTELGSHIRHDRDFELSYMAMEQFRGKYLVRDRRTKTFLETPQVLYMMVAATIFSQYPRETRLNYVKEYYDAISTHEISLPTPIIAGARTPQRQFSSCVVLESGDSLESITSTTTGIVKYVSQRAGIGVGAGRIRAVDSPIRGGHAVHTGVLPFYKLFNSAVHSCSQGAVRKGSATLYVPWFHLEIEDVLFYKNNKGTEENRLRTIDYGIQFNKLFYERYLANETVTLFSPADMGEAYEYFFTDQEKFKEAYLKLEANKKVRKKVVSAKELMSTFAQQRRETGRYYVMNVDHCNDHSSFITEKAPIRLSNLCAEITLPTNPMAEDDAEIALCTLSAINLGKFKKPSDMKRACELAVRALDAVLTYQGYPVEEAKKAQDRRALGIGVINLAYWLAKNDISYQDVDERGLALVHEWFEAMSFYLIEASVKLAKEFGPCGLYLDTKYSEGIVPIDTYKRDLDEVVAPVYKMDWDRLRSDLREFGIRNSTLMACMPAETSATVSNATNGIEPPRAIVSIKKSKDTIAAQVVPEPKKLKNKYDLLWDQRSPRGYLKIAAVMQKFIDQAMSVNTSYNPDFFDKGEIPMSTLVGDLLFAYKLGTKNLYYDNTPVALNLKLDEEPVVVPVQEEVSCDSCVL